MRRMKRSSIPLEITRNGPPHVGHGKDPSRFPPLGADPGPGNISTPSIHKCKLTMISYSSPGHSIPPSALRRVYKLTSVLLVALSSCPWSSIVSISILFPGIQALHSLESLVGKTGTMHPKAETGISGYINSTNDTASGPSTPSPYRYLPAFRACCSIYTQRGFNQYRSGVAGYLRIQESKRR